MSGGRPHGDLCEIRVLDFPLDIHQRSTEAFEGLRREFTLVAMRTPEAIEVPARLLELVDALTGEYAGLNDEADARRDAATQRGERVLPELLYRLPAAAAAAAISLNEVLDEADAFCRDGEALLSLASPPEAVAFRRWYLGEIVAQLNGEPPLPWPEADINALLKDSRLRGAPDDSP